MGEIDLVTFLNDLSSHSKERVGDTNGSQNHDCDDVKNNGNGKNGKIKNREIEKIENTYADVLKRSLQKNKEGETGDRPPISHSLNNPM